MAKLDWNETDDLAVDTVRVLAMDSVQKVGNGHPGTAMSLAPAAYLLFQKVMRHDPSDPHWPGRDRFVLSCGHSSVTLYIQLYLGGWGLELEDLKSLRTWGSKTPGHPEYGHTAGVETTTGPLGQGVANAVGMAMAARREHGLLDPNAGEGESPFDHFVYAMASDGDLEEGVSGEASSIAGTQRLGNLILIYDDNAISIEDNTEIAFTEDVAARYEAYGWHVQTVDWTHGGHGNSSGYQEDVPALYDAILKAAARHRPAELHPAPHDHRLAGPQPPEHLQGPRQRARRRRGGRHQGDPRLRPGPDLRGPARRHRAHPQGDRARPGRAGRVADDVRRLVAQAVRRRRPLRAAADPHPARRLGRRPADLPRRREGPRDPQGQRRGHQRHRPARPRAVGRVGRPGRVQQHHHRGRALLPAEGPLRPALEGRPVRRPGAALRRPRARHGLDHERHRRLQRHPRVRRHVPDVLRLHARRGPARGRDGPAGDLRLDPRLHRPRRGRADPPAHRAPRRAARDPGPRRRPPGRRQRDRGLLARDPRAQRPPGRPGPHPPERPDVPAGRGGLQRHGQRQPRRLRPHRRRR